MSPDTTRAMQQDRAELEQAVVAADQSGNTALQLEALLDLAQHQLTTGEFDSAYETLQVGLPIANEFGDRELLAEAKRMLADFFRYKSQAAEAEPLYRELIGIAQDMGDKMLLADCQMSLARLKMPQGQQDEAWALYESAGKHYDELGAKGRVGQTWAGRGDVAFHRGDAAAARQYYEQALTLCTAAEDALGQAHTLKSLGRLVAQEEGPEAALPVLEKSLAAYQAAGFRYGEAFTWQYYAQVAGQVRELRKAHEALGRSAELFDAMKLPGQAARMRDYQQQVKYAMDEQSS